MSLVKNGNYLLIHQIHDDLSSGIHLFINFKKNKIKENTKYIIDKHRLEFIDLLFNSSDDLKEFIDDLNYFYSNYTSFENAADELSISKNRLLYRLKKTAANNA